MKVLNINAFIKIKLFDRGRKIYEEFLKEPYIGLQGYEKECKKFKEPDGMGYTKFQIWELMQIFGKEVFNGSKAFFDKNQLLIDEKDLKEEEL